MNNTGDRAPASVAENVEKVIRVESETLRPRSRSEAIIDKIGGFVGTNSFVIAQVVAFALWIIVNAGAVPRLGPFDPFPYPLLSSITSLEAVLLAAFVLMKQNRMGMVADRRDHLDLQVNLLTNSAPLRSSKCSTGLARVWASISTMTRVAASWPGMSPSNTLSKSCTPGCPTRESSRARFDHHAADDVAAMLAVGTVAGAGVRRIAGPCIHACPRRDRQPRARSLDQTAQCS